MTLLKGSYFEVYLFSLEAQIFRVSSSQLYLKSTRLSVLFFPRAFSAMRHVFRFSTFVYTTQYNTNLQNEKATKLVT